MTGMRCLSLKKKELSETYFIRDGVATYSTRMMDSWMGGKRQNKQANHVPLKASGLIYCQKGRRFMFVNNPTPQ